MFYHFKKKAFEKGYIMEYFVSKEHVYWNIENKKLHSKAILKRYEEHLYMTIDQYFPLELLPLLVQEMKGKALFVNYCNHLLCSKLETIGFTPLKKRVLDPIFFVFEKQRENLYVLEKDSFYIDKKIQYYRPIFQKKLNSTDSYAYTWCDPIGIQKI